MGDEARRIVDAVSGSRRYRSVAPAVIERLAGEELPRARTTDEAIKRVKRRLHQSVGAYAPMGRADPQANLARVRAALAPPVDDPELRAACAELMARHASTRERLPHLDRFYAGIWDAVGGLPGSLLDLGCGLAPLALPWMGLAHDAFIRAIDADAAQLALVDGFLDQAGQPHAVEAGDLAAATGPPLPAADVAFLLKLVPILDRQDPGSAARLLGGLRARHAVVSFPARSLRGRVKGMDRIYRHRLETLVSEVEPKVVGVAEASVSNELVFVLSLAPLRTADG
ncbi:MAG TPA: 16S rRNA methyltransferase [Candidatus Limnocylindria bacterium]|nr:16S rRNA methyltransferase [Candidatus Limnocylindria bacterium]